MKIKQVAELLEVGIYESFSPEKTQTIKELLAELGLSDKYLAVLVNGKKAGLDAIVSETDNIVILPHIAGGAEEKDFCPFVNGKCLEERCMLYYQAGITKFGCAFYAIANNLMTKFGCAFYAIANNLMDIRKALEYMHK